MIVSTKKSRNMYLGGLMCGCWPRLCVAFHVLFSVLYICVGAVQLIAGIFFLISLPVFKIGSNLWTGGWNVLVGVGGAVFSCVGDITPAKHHALLYLTISVTVVNVVNLLILELGEWRLLMPDTIKRLIQQKHLKTLVLYARSTTSISSAFAAVSSFIDAQLMFWWFERCLPSHAPLQHNETISDIEYIIPRVKSGSMGKNNSHNNMLNQYAQSWVFDSDTVGSSQSDSPYNKLPSQFNGSKTVVLKRKQRQETQNVSEGETAVQPVVLVEDTTNSDRQLPFMTSFSRTPSPVPGLSEGDGDSSSQCSNPPAIYECLERLTEPSVYRARLNTAIGANVDRTSPSVSPRPHSTVISEQVQYASLMMELNKTIETKFPPSKSPNVISQTVSQRDSRRPSSKDDSMRKGSTSDAEFSKELEAALQLIQDLESPNTAETPSEGTMRLAVTSDSDNGLYETLKAGKQCVIHNEGNKTIISLSPQKKYTSIVNIVPLENRESCDQPITKEPISSTYCNTQKAKDLDCKSQNFTIPDIRVVPENGKCNIADSCETAVVPPPNCDIKFHPLKNGRVSLLTKHKSFKDYPDVEFNNNHIHKGSKTVLGRSISLTEKDTNSLTRPRWSIRTLLLKRKPSQQLKLTPELESAILKSESLAHLSELELIARYDQNKMVQRQIEEKAWQMITGNSLSDSSC